MNFQLTREQALTKKMVEKFCEEVVAPTADDMDVAHEFPVDIVKQMGELGMMGIMWPKEYGGPVLRSNRETYSCTRCSWYSRCCAHIAVLRPDLLLWYRRAETGVARSAGKG